MIARLNLFLQLLGLFFFGSLAIVTAAERPNIIFILTDDMGYGDIGVLGQNDRRIQKIGPAHRTPHIDQLAAEGIVLTDHYCAAPVCAPSRASLLTGLHQGHATVRNQQFDKMLEDNHTLGTVLQAAGYRTACIGKWGLVGELPARPGHPLRRGFDFYFGGLLHIDAHDHYPKEGPHRGPKQVWAMEEEISNQLDKCYATDLYTARAKAWIEEQHRERARQPFFLLLAFPTPHAPLALPTMAYPQGGGINGGMQWLGTPGKMINTAAGKIDDWTHPDYRTAKWDHDKNPATRELPWPDVYQRYATSVRRIDDAVGDLLQLLKDLSIDRNTLVVLTHDNGPSQASYLPQAYSPKFFGSYGPFSGVKSDLYEGGIRNGALLRWPDGINAGTKSDQPSGQWDWLPTMAELAGVPPPARTDGTSLVPTLTGNGKQAESSIYIEYSAPGKTPDIPDFPATIRNQPRGEMQMIRQGEWIGLRTNMQSAEQDFQIFQIKNDPRQAANLADMHPELQSVFKQSVLRMRRPDASSPRLYDGLLVPADFSLATKKFGFDYAVYAGNWPWLPDFDLLEPVTTGHSDQFKIEMPPQSQMLGIRFRGVFQAPTSGEYEFFMRTDDRAQLRLHKLLLTEVDFHPQTSWVSAKVLLENGPHPWTLMQRIATAAQSGLEVEWSGPDLPRQPLRPAVMPP